MRCAICSVPDSERQLYEGIAIGEMIMVCEPCSEERRIPRIKKPSVNQLEKAEEYHTVRERMERLSGMRRPTTSLSDDSSSSQALRARLKEPPKTQVVDGVVHNYHWNLTLARRRRKLTAAQVASQTGISQEVIMGIERGRIPKDFLDVFPKLEDFFGIELLVQRPKKVSFVRRDEKAQAEILESVKQKMSARDAGEMYDITPTGDAIVEEVPDIEEAPVQAPKRSFTLSGLIDRKRARDKRRREEEEKKREAEMVGDDLDLDIDMSEL